jgi:hypothetical protein
MPNAAQQQDAQADQNTARNAQAFCVSGVSFIRRIYEHDDIGTNQ